LRGFEPPGVHFFANIYWEIEIKRGFEGRYEGLGIGLLRKRKTTTFY